MTEQTKTDRPKDVAWEKATSVIRSRILALREKQAEAAKAGEK